MCEIFRKVPFVSNLKCTSDGKFFVENTGEEVVQEYAEHFGYMVISWNGNQYFCHRLIAMAWLPLPERPFSELQVNHSDGNKLNNDSSNLEWVTVSQNRIHAIEQGLAPAVRILRKDLRTGNVVRYLSINECAREVGISPATVIKFIDNPDTVRKIYYVFIREGQKWPNLTKDDIGKHLKGMPRIVRMHNSTTGVSFAGKLVSSAAGILGVRADALYAWMRVNNGNGKTYKGWEITFEEDPTVLERIYKSIPKHVPDEKAKRKQFGYIVRDTLTRLETTYGSADEVCSALGISRNYLRCIMSRNKGIYKRLVFKYSTSHL